MAYNDMEVHRSSRIDELAEWIEEETPVLSIHHVEPHEYTEGPPTYLGSQDNSFYEALPISYDLYRIMAYRGCALVTGLKDAPYGHRYYIPEEAIFLGDIEVFDELESYLLFHAI